jgi:hypothetical protein
MVAVGLVAATAAFGVGPWPGLAPSVTAPSGGVRYTATRAHGSTTVRTIRAGTGEILASANFAGA